MRKFKAVKNRTTYLHNSSNTNNLGHNSKHKMQHHYSVELKQWIPHLTKKYVYETYLNDYDMIKPT